MGISRESVVVASRRQLSSELTGGAVIMDVSRGVYYGLNPIGTRIWQMVKEPRTVGEVIETVLAEYEADEQRVERDVIALIEKLSGWGLLHVSAGKTA